MVSLSHPTKSPNSLHIFSSMNKSPSSPSSLNSSMKLKTLIHNLIFSHIYRVARVFSKAKSIILEVFKGNQLIFLKQSTQKKNIYRNKILFGSFRLHYNWCSSSHVLPINISSPNNNIILEGKNGKSSSTTTTTSHIYYDSSWNSMFSTSDDEDVHQGQFGNLGNNKEEELEEGGELSSYLQWLEEKKDGATDIEDEIDKLADMFIANCHEKFRLEKIESYRRYQAMLARSM